VRVLEPNALALEAGVFTQEGLVAPGQVDWFDTIVKVFGLQVLPIIKAWSEQQNVPLEVFVAVHLGVVFLFASQLAATSIGSALNRKHKSKQPPILLVSQAFFLVRSLLQLTRSMLLFSSSTAEPDERDMITAKMKKKMVLIEAIVSVMVWFWFDANDFVSPSCRFRARRHVDVSWAPISGGLGSSESAWVTSLSCEAFAKRW
jgi:hypothetical protein